ncbi:TetR/AcrR family transcriptional regulator [Rhodococcus erythropolis]|uniref:TetR/AcrR family transcriptional regulator n=1 Tax=Rhodococcus erythropolis TaxID=1833 RepID=UPI001BAAC4E9|nr:TetR/AcrR family transcriptional regulator [Rhodococcus erythropolis]MBS2993387.1 TetR/AcrR family transcriptional regulator [Rhodococcus erythropolis]
MNNHTDRSEGIDHGKTGRPPMQPRAKATREGILEVSATLFSKTGYAGTSINDILAISQSTKGAMYFHFSKKESIAREMLRRWSDAVTEAVGKAAATGQPADRQVMMIYRELARRTQNEPIIRAGLVLSVEQSLNDAYATYEAWTEALSSYRTRANVPDRKGRRPRPEPNRGRPSLGENRSSRRNVHSGTERSP